MVWLDCRVSDLTRGYAQIGSTVVLARLLTSADFGLVATVSPILNFAATLNDVGFG